MATVKSESILTRVLPPRLKKRQAEAPGTTYVLLKITPEMNRVIEDLVARSGLPEADVLNMAVGFLKAAADAVAEGKRVGFLTEDGNFDMEFTGL